MNKLIVIKTANQTNSDSMKYNSITFDLRIYDFNI